MTHSTTEPRMISALAQFARRRFYAQQIEKIDNAGLPAGSPMYFYCGHCGIPTEFLPEDYVFPPALECSQCQGLKSEGWLEEAISAASNESVIGDADLGVWSGQHRNGVSKGDDQ